MKAELKSAMKNIHALNDSVLEDAFQGKDLHGALRVLHQIEAAISVSPLLCRTAPMRITNAYIT
jgi:hypothetical protein